MPATVEQKTKARRFTVRDDQGQVLGTGAELRKVPVNDIKIDSAYQRDVSSQWVHLNGPFDVQRAGAVILSSRAGGPYCIDGGHRLALARESGVWHCNALVIDGLTQRDEARMFTQYQRVRTNLTSFALYRADVTAGDADTLAILTVVNNSGFFLAKTSGPLNITAIDAVRFVHKYGGVDLLTGTLELIKRKWFDLPKATSGQIIKGLALFLSSAGDQPAFKLDRLERVMDSLAPLKVMLHAQSIASKRNAQGTSAANVAEAFQNEYDKKRGKDEQPLAPLVIGRRRRPGARSK